MSKLKHTPKPWRVLEPEAHRPYLRIRGTCLGGRYKIANVLCPQYDGVHDRENDETIANARLIAASPDMLDALIAQYNHTKNDHHVNGMNEATKSAIEFATGLPIEEVLK